jgi:hypothetical protein
LWFNDFILVIDVPYSCPASHFIVILVLVLKVSLFGSLNFNPLNRYLNSSKFGFALGINYPYTVIIYKEYKITTDIFIKRNPSA